jgi:hypothetical protein
MSEHTACVLIASTSEFMFGTRIRVQYLLLLSEGSRAVWEVHQLGSHPRRTLMRPGSPRHLLADALLAYLCLSCPAEVAADPTLARLARFGTGGDLAARPLSDADANHVCRAAAGRGQISVTIWPGSTLADADIQSALSQGVDVADESRAQR